MIRSANAGDGFTLIEANATTTAIVPGPANDVEKVVTELRNIKPTHTAGDYTAAVNLLADLLAKSPRNYPRRQVTFIGDLQRSAWNPVLPRADTPAPEAWARITGKADIAVLDVADGDYDNLCIAEMSLADPLALVDSPTVVLASVQNYGKVERSSVRLELRVSKPGKDGDGPFVPMEGRVIDRLEPGGRFSVAFVLDGPSRFREAGTHLVQVRLSDADDLTPDDSRTLAVDVRDSVPCLLVNGTPSLDPLRRASGYLQTALDPNTLRGSGNPARPRTLSLAEFGDVAMAELARVDCVFLCDVPSVSPAQLARLEAHLNAAAASSSASGRMPRRIWRSTTKCCTPTAPACCRANLPACSAPPTSTTLATCLQRTIKRTRKIHSPRSAITTPVRDSPPCHSRSTCAWMRRPTVKPAASSRSYPPNPRLARTPPARSRTRPSWKCRATAAG